MFGCNNKNVSDPDGKYSKGTADTEIAVTEYGAVGDGTAENSAAINAAISAASEGGKGLYFPAGRYVVSKTVTFPQDIFIRFEEGAVLVMDTSRKIVSVKCPVIAGDYQIFEGDGLLPGISDTVSTGNPMWFGAKGDGKTDDTKAFAATWSIFNQIELPYTENGYVLSEITTFKNMVLKGREGEKRPKIIASKGCERLFKVVPPGYVTVSNISFSLSEMPAPSTVFCFDSTQYLEYFYLDHCDFTDAYNVFSDARSTGVMMFMHFEDSEFFRGRGQVFDIEDFEGFIFMKRLKIDYSESYTYHGIEHGITAIDIDDVRGTIFEELELIGGNTGYDDEYAFYIPGNVALMASLWWDRVNIRDFGGYAIYLNNTTLCSFLHVNISNCGGGMRLSDSWDLQITDANIRDIKKYNGIIFSSCRNSQIINTKCKNCESNGIKLSSCSCVTVIDCKTEKCKEYGYYDSGSSSCSICRSEVGGNKSDLKIASSTGAAYEVVCGGETVSLHGKAEK